MVEVLYVCGNSDLPVCMRTPVTPCVFDHCALYLLVNIHPMCSALLIIIP